jgi:tetraacyldisaccharide 4'-kinase
MRAPEFWGRRDWRALALSPLGLLYGASVAWKASRAKPYRSKASVICVGNLTAGGAGKTPIAIAIADVLRARGRNPFFLTRGYGGRLHGPILVGDDSSARDVGDEPLLLHRVAPVVVARDRHAGAVLAEAHGADTIIMDDGLQNFGLAKDLSLVVVDGESGFGNGYVVPAGPLREPIAQGLARADAVIIVGDGNPDLATFPRPVLRAHLLQQDDLAHRRLVAFAGIGRPEKFFQALEASGAELAATKRYADHHAYTPSEIARLKSKARSCDALLVTTEKDFVRLTQAEREGMHAVPIRAVFDSEAGIERLLDRFATTR